MRRHCLEALVGGVSDSRAAGPSDRLSVTRLACDRLTAGGQCERG